MWFGLGACAGSVAVSTDTARTAPCCPAQETGQTSLDDVDREQVSGLCSSLFPTLVRFELTDGRVPGVEGDHRVVYPVSPDNRIILDEPVATLLGDELADFFRGLEDFDMAFATKKAARVLDQRLAIFEQERGPDTKEADYGLRLIAHETINLGSQLVALGATQCAPDFYRSE